MEPLTLHRLEFAFTITYHYLFPQLTMGLALVLVVFAYRANLKKDEVARGALRFWSKVFGVNFVFGVITGIPMEFHFGAGWSRFSEATGGVIGQTLAMEGVFAFFLESSFLYLLLFGEKKLGPRAHFASAVLVMMGSWASAFFIIVTNAFMQHPVGHRVLPDGRIVMESLAEYVTNSWAFVELAHTLLASIVTASFVVASVGAFYLLKKQHADHAKLFLKVGVTLGAIASVLVAFPAGDAQAKRVAADQPATFAAMEGHFHTEDGAGLSLIGQPDVEKMQLDNPVVVPRALSFMTHQRWNARIRGLSEFDRADWPDNVPLLYYSYHFMVGLGTMFIALTATSLVLLRKGRLYRTRPALWALMLALPFPYIANTAGWLTAELGRQPWLVYGLMRTRDGSTTTVSSGNVLFSLLGFMGLYAFLSLLFFFLIQRIVARGPAAHEGEEPQS
ncbi:MAG TPA: cytochrome ubiquinol oxidase subunit I [Polyangiaceae bacterium]|nr:cytochrome ubiquinol oxidase subunit I [Polyangiaceae bacterium]